MAPGMALAMLAGAVIRNNILARVQVGEGQSGAEAAA